jgi:signal peptidase I
MKNIEFKIPDGYEVDKENSTGDKLVFKYSNKVETYEDIAKKLFLGKKNTYYFDEGCATEYDYVIIEDDILDASTSLHKEQLENLLELNKLINVANYLNDGYEFNYKDRNQKKYFIQITKGSIIINYHYYTMMSVHFKSEELAKKAIEILGEDSIRKALTLNY